LWTAAGCRFTEENAEIAEKNAEKHNKEVLLFLCALCGEFLGL
jgi:hypothetical protein